MILKVEFIALLCYIALCVAWIVEIYKNRDAPGRVLTWIVMVVSGTFAVLMLIYTGIKVFAG